MEGAAAFAFATMVVVGGLVFSLTVYMEARWIRAVLERRWFHGSGVEQPKSEKTSYEIVNNPGSDGQMLDLDYPAANSDGRKSEDHRRKRAACWNKELILEEVLEKSGLYGVYRAWAYGK